LYATPLTEGLFATKDFLYFACRRFAAEFSTGNGDRKQAKKKSVPFDTEN
jgi:hypothetical protein